MAPSASLGANTSKVISRKHVRRRNDDNGDVVEGDDTDENNDGRRTTNPRGSLEKPMKEVQGVTEEEGEEELQIIEGTADG